VGDVVGVGGDVEAVLEEHRLVVGVGGGGEEVLVGEAEEARVVEDGHALVAAGAHLVSLLEARRDAVAARGGALVAAALPEGVHRARCRPGDGRGEESG